MSESFYGGQMIVEGFTYRMKLDAIQHARYNGGAIWTPRVGDLYTIIRADLEVFRIAAQDGKDFLIEPCWEGTHGEFRFPVDGFTTDYFGPNRIHIPLWIVERLTVRP